MPDFITEFLKFICSETVEDVKLHMYCLGMVLM